MMRNYITLCLFLFSCSLASCFSQRHITYTTAPIYKQHVLEVSSDGTHRDRDMPGKENGILPKNEHFKQILAGLDRYIADSPKNEEGKSQIMIFFHGGLNGVDPALKRVIKQTPLALGDCTYPIFINWDCDFGSSYGQHLVSVSAGVRYAYMKRYIVPLTFASDILTGIMRSPLSMFNNVGTYSFNFGTYPPKKPKGWRTPSRKNADTYYNILRDRMVANKDSAINVKIGADYRQGALPVVRNILSAARLPTRVAGGMLLWDGLGTPSWMNMKRRAHAAFHPDFEFDIRDQRTHPTEVNNRLDTDHSGVVSDFMDLLVKHLNKYDTSLYELTVIGHSMGAIITNELVNEYPDLQITNIVHMAAASSLRDVKNCIMPYLEEHTSTRYYNLTLHPASECRESFLNSEYVVPRGTLLVHIDNTFERPPSFMDRTSGRWENMIQATHLFPASVRSRITVKSFDVLSKQAISKKDEKNIRANNFHPQKHGQFNKGPFWNKEFWYIK